MSKIDVYIKKNGLLNLTSNDLFKRILLINILIMLFFRFMFTVRLFASTSVYVSILFIYALLLQDYFPNIKEYCKDPGVK